MGYNGISHVRLHYYLLSLILGRVREYQLYEGNNAPSSLSRQLGFHSNKKFIRFPKSKLGVGLTDVINVILLRREMR